MIFEVIIEGNVVQAVETFDHSGIWIGRMDIENIFFVVGEVSRRMGNTISWIRDSIPKRSTVRGVN